jgi:site-specific DNA-methyltransferase (adenine-specific)
LVVTSPPYPGVEQPTDDYVTFIDPDAFEECHRFLDSVWASCFHILNDLGRLVVNIYDIPRGEEGMLPNVARVISGCMVIGYVFREDYIWHKGASYRPPKGSWPLPKGVMSGNTYEHCLVFQKPLKFSQRRIDPASYPEEAKKKAVLDAQASKWLADPVWQMPADREARKLGHPFPFPPELPERFIKLYSMPTDIVFDPFGGAGTTGIVAHRLERHGVITELSRNFIDMIDLRTAQGTLM